MPSGDLGSVIAGVEAYWTLLRTITPNRRSGRSRGRPEGGGKGVLGGGGEKRKEGKKRGGDREFS